MIATSVGLAVLAVLLASPVPIALSRAAWPQRAPATALLLWQAIALAGGLSMLGALFLAGLAPLGTTLPRALGTLGATLATGSLPAGLGPGNVLALCAGVLLGGHLVLTLIATIVSAERERRRHRELITLLSSPVNVGSGTRLLAHDAPVAYCLPDGVRSVTVLSAGLLRVLDEQQLRAVIEHERAHLLQRHWIVLTAFTAWNRALPWFPTASRAKRAVGELVEMLADDRARHTVPGAVVAQAIALVSAPSGSAEGSGQAGVLAARVQRLLDFRPLPPLGSLAIVLAAVLLVAVPTLVIVVPR